MPPVKWGHARDFGGEPWEQQTLQPKAALRRSGLRSRNCRHSHGSVLPYFFLPGLRLRRSLLRHLVGLASEEEEGEGRRASCPTAGLALPDEGSEEGLRGVSTGDNRSLANNPLSAPIAGGNEITVIGLTMDNRLRLVRANSRREVTAAAAHAVQLTSLGGAKDIRLRLVQRKSRRDGGRREEPVMATHVAHRQKWSKENQLWVAV
jgi:hypothetical protein